MPVVHNHRSYKYFCENNPESRWRARVRHTFEWAVSRDVFLEHNFECHCPQLFDGNALVKGMQGVDYTTQPGLTIYTTWRVVTDTWHESVDQNEVKTTVETNFPPCVDTLLQPFGHPVPRSCAGRRRRCVGDIHRVPATATAIGGGNALDD